MGNGSWRRDWQRWGRRDSSSHRLLRLTAQRKRRWRQERRSLSQVLVGGSGLTPDRIGSCRRWGGSRRGNGDLCLAFRALPFFAGKFAGHAQSGAAASA